MSERPKTIPKGVPPESLLRPIADDRLRYLVSWMIQRFALLPLCFLWYRLVHRITIHGAENFAKVDGGSFLLCPNHTSAWDSPCSGVYVSSSWRRFWRTRTHWTVLADPLRLVYRPLQYFCIWMGVIPVDRKAGMEQFTLQDALRILKEGTRDVVLTVYPEGTRSKTGRVAPRGKVGVGWFQKRSGVPVLPIYHKGFPDLPGLGKRVEFWVGEPMYFEEYRDEPDAPLTWKGIANDVVEELKRLETIAYAEDEAAADG